MEIIGRIVKTAVDNVEGLDEKSQEITNLLTVIKNKTLLLEKVFHQFTKLLKDLFVCS